MWFICSTLVTLLGTWKVRRSEPCDSCFSCSTKAGHPASTTSAGSGPEEAVGIGGPRNGGGGALGRLTEATTRLELLFPWPMKFRMF